MSQFGFRTSVGTVDAILKNKLIQQITAKTDKTVYSLYIDLIAACDRCIQSWMFETIWIRTPRGADTKIIDLLETFYSSTTAFIRQDESKIFTTNLGVHQGGIAYLDGTWIGL